MTAFTDPGTPSSPEWRAWRAKQSTEAKDEIKKNTGGEDSEVAERVAIWENSLPTFESVKSGSSVKQKKKHCAIGVASECERCHDIRPERAHHCRQCDHCVLRMDHHCPLIGNCVGWCNVKFYLLLQLYQCIACVVFLFAPGSPGELAVYGIAESYHMQLMLYVGVCWAFVVMLISGRTFAVTMFMAARNETHIECAGQFTGGNPYRLTILENLRQLLGPLDLRLLLPLPVHRPCPGTSFPIDKNCCNATDAMLKAHKSGEASSPYGSV